jgi:hypothetical protein
MATGSGFSNSDVTPKWAFRAAPAPLGSEEPSVTLKLMRMTVAQMKILRAVDSSEAYLTLVGEAACDGSESVTEVTVMSPAGALDVAQTTRWGIWWRSCL